MGRIDKDNYYLDIAKAVSGRGTCLVQNRGAIIVKNDEIVSTGYSGAPRGRKNCSTLGECVAADGRNSECCRSVHAEANAIISAARRDMISSTMYLVAIDADGGSAKDSVPCTLCKKLIINSGIAQVVCRCGGVIVPINVRDWIYKDETLDSFK